MQAQGTFGRVDATLRQVFEELRAREPIFHTAAFGRTPPDLERATAPDYWEVGASGRRYSRQFILSHAAEVLSRQAIAAGWLVRDEGLRELGRETYLFTYTLEQGKRITRRATIWERAPQGWRILYHQGTIVTAEEDDTIPCEGNAVS